MRPPLQLIYNYHWVVAREAARSAQPPAFLLKKLLAQNGLRAVVNLRGEHLDERWWLRERDLCAAHGIAYFSAGLDSRSLPTQPMLADLITAFEQAPRPFLIKCSGGQDRTSLASAIYILHRKGFDAREEALAQFQAMPYLHFPRRHQKWLRHFPAYAEEQSGGDAIGTWIRERYDPHAFASWLNDRGLGTSFKEVYIRPRDRIRAQHGQ